MMIGISTVQGAPVGIALFAALLAFGLYELLRAASAASLLAPVLVGLIARAVVMLVAQLLSHGGIFYLDDGGYTREASLIAHEWVSGHLVNPSSYRYAGSLAFGYQVTVALVFMLVGKSVLAAKLVNVLLGGATVLLLGLLARRLFAQAGGRRAAWLMAVIPTSVWWSSVVLKETLVAFLLVGAMLALTHLPRRRAVVFCVLALAILGVTRSTAVVALSGSVLALLGTEKLRRRKTVSLRALLGPIAGVVAVLAVGLIGVSGGHPLAVLSQVGHTLGRMGLASHQGIAGAVASVPKSLVSPYPWVFTKSTLTWDRALYPGMWVWYALLPTAAVGLWRLRRRAEALLLALPAATLLTVNAFTAGFTFRQRSTVEPLLLLLVVAGADSWRGVVRRAAGGYAVVAMLAYLQSHSAATAGLVALAAVGMVLLASRLPAQRTLRVPLLEGLSPQLANAVLAGSSSAVMAALGRQFAAARAAAPRIDAEAGWKAFDEWSKLSQAMRDLAPRRRNAPVRALARLSTLSARARSRAANGPAHRLVPVDAAVLAGGMRSLAVTRRLSPRPVAARSEAGCRIAALASALRREAPPA